MQGTRALLESSGQRYLVTRADGAVRTGLEQAISVYKNVCHRAGSQSHSARYAFARECMQACRAEGFGEREARVAPLDFLAWRRFAGVMSRVFVRAASEGACLRLSPSAPLSCCGSVDDSVERTGCSVSCLDFTSQKIMFCATIFI